MYFIRGQNTPFSSREFDQFQNVISGALSRNGPLVVIYRFDREIPERKLELFRQENLFPDVEYGFKILQNS